MVNKILSLYFQAVSMYHLAYVLLVSDICVLRVYFVFPPHCPMSLLYIFIKNFENLRVLFSTNIAKMVVT
jgi:hypothetical protein